LEFLLFLADGLLDLLVRRGLLTFVHSLLLPPEALSLSPSADLPLPRVFLPPLLVLVVLFERERERDFLELLLLLERPRLVVFLGRPLGLPSDFFLLEAPDFLGPLWLFF
jgi:hypothetical protein